MKNAANDDLLVGSSIDDLSNRRPTGTFSEDPATWILTNTKQLTWTILIVVGAVVGFRYNQELQEAKKGEQVFKLSQILGQLSKISSESQIKLEELTGINDSIRIFKSEATSDQTELTNSLISLVEARVLLLKGDSTQAIIKLEDIRKTNSKLPSLANGLATLALARIYLDGAPDVQVTAKDLLTGLVKSGEFACIDALKVLDTIALTADDRTKIKDLANELVKRRPDTRRGLGTFLSDFNSVEFLSSEPVIIEQ